MTAPEDMSLSTFSELTFCSTIGYYLPVILKDYVGLSDTTSRIVAAAGSMNYFVFSIMPIWFIDKVGRRPCMLWGAAGMSVVSALICVGFNVPGNGGAIMTVVMYFLFYSVFALSYLNVSRIYAPVSYKARVLISWTIAHMREQEINSLKMRSMGASLASASNWLCKSLHILTK